MCFNKKVIGALIAVALGLVAFNPGLALRLMPVLLMAACPLSMLAMSRSIFKRSRSTGLERENAASVERIAVRVADVQSRTQLAGVTPVQSPRPLAVSGSWEQ